MPATKDTSETAKKIQAVNILSKNKPASDKSLRLNQRHLVLKCQRRTNDKTEKKLVAGVAGKKKKPCNVTLLFKEKTQVEITPPLFPPPCYSSHKLSVKI